MSRLTCFVTGASGLLGRAVAARLLADPRVAKVYTLVRRSPVASGFSTASMRGDLMLDGLGMTKEDCDRLAREVTTVVHCAANTSFAQSLADARAVNRDGTLRLLELSADWPQLERWVYVSTAFVAGLCTGRILEDDAPDRTGASAWANAYEQSKAEAEAALCAVRSDWCIVRPATVACDDMRGGISQMNAVHRALRLYFSGLAAMLPATDASRVDVVTTDYVARGIARAVVAPRVEQKRFHLCAGSGAMPLDDLLNVSYDAFQRAPDWRRKGIARPVCTDLETYRIFERAIDDAGSDRARRALRSLGHFVPQIARPKVFDTANADALLGYCALPVASFWAQMVDHLVSSVAAAREAA